jgi:DNA recombination protein RmuC
MIDIGKSLDDAKESYEDAVKRLSTGSGNAIRQAEMLIELGVKAKKHIPASLVERSHDLLPGEQSDAAKA